MPRPSLEVRRARLDDLDDLLGLLVESREDVPAGIRALHSADPQTLRLRLAEVLSGPDTQFLIARQEGRPVGFLALRTAPISVLAETCAMHIDQLYVAPDQRRHGVGRALLVAVAGLAERAGAEQVISSVSPMAKDTHRFFARLGFAPLVVRRVVSTSTLRRRLSGGESRRGGLDDLLSRRRSLRARSLWPGSGAGGRSADLPVPAAPPTLELPVIGDRAEPEGSATVDPLCGLVVDAALAGELADELAGVLDQAAEPLRSDTALA